MKMLHDGRMAGPGKLHRRTGLASGRRLWAGSRQSCAGELTQLLHSAHFDNKGGLLTFATDCANGGSRTNLPDGI
jgi:hypothetical protein